MFSQDDLLEVYRLFPPEKTFRLEKSGDLPLLIKIRSGDHFITARSLHESFERLVTAKSGQVPLSAVSSELDVDSHVVLQLVRANPVLALLNRDGNSIFLKEERDTIVEDLKRILAKELVYRAAFIESHDLHWESLERILQIREIKESLADETEDFLLSDEYAIALSQNINQKLKEGLSNLGIIELRPQSFLGTPPVWLIRQRLDHIQDAIVNEIDVVSQFYIEEKADMVHCTPKESIQKQRDELITSLKSGENFCIRLENFSGLFRELYQSPEALKKHLSSFPFIAIIDTFAVSTESLSGIAADSGRRLEDQGYLDLKTILPPEVPREIEDDVRHNVIQRIHMAVVEDGNPIHDLGDSMLKSHKYDDQRQAILAIAKAQANQRWESLKESTDKDPKFQMAEVIASIPDNEPLLRAVAQQKELETAAAEQFSKELSDLESKNEGGFSTFWTERVSLRVYTYDEGLKSVDDAKLHEQLRDLLSSHLQKEFLLDMTSKARSQGLVYSRRTRKNVNRFEATLKTSKADLSSILSTLDKFSKKQGLSEIEPNATAEAKKALIQDMVRRMQKPKTDGPLMFLSLVIILMAKHHPGVVYATGKFAPKLLKQLKTNLSGAEYEQVEKWKEQAKAGALDKENREAMVRMAESAF